MYREISRPLVYIVVLNTVLGMNWVPIYLLEQDNRAKQFPAGRRLEDCTGHGLVQGKLWKVHTYPHSQDITQKQIYFEI